MQPVRYCAEALRTMWASGASYDEIAAALGCSTSFVAKLKVRHKLPHRQKSAREVFADDPTPEQIAAATADIRHRHLEAMRRESADASRGRASRTSQAVSDAIRCYSWDGVRFSEI